MGRISFKKPNLDRLLGVPWWMPAATAAALYAAIQWGMPAIEAASPAFRRLDGMLKAPGMLLVGVCAAFAAFLYYKQRIKSSQAVRLLEPHFSIPTPTATPKGSGPEANDQASGDPAIDSVPRRSATGAPQWSLELLRQIDSKAFEELVAACFREESFRTEAIPGGVNQGSDIRLYEKGKREVYAVVLCRSCHDQTLGVSPVRELLGAITHDSVARGILVTTGDYEQEAIDFAKAHPIILISGEMLINDMLSYTDDARTRLMNILIDAGFDVMPAASAEAAVELNHGADDGSPGLDFPIAESNFTDAALNAVAAEAQEESPAEAAVASNEDPESIALDFPALEFGVTNALADRAADRGPSEKAEDSDSHLNTEAATLDFPMLEFPASESTTKNSEFLGLTK